MIINYETDDRIRIRGARLNTTLDRSVGTIPSLNRKQINNLLGGRDFQAVASAAFKVRGMDGTFIALNDNRPGFQAKRDGVLFLKDFNVNDPGNSVTIRGTRQGDILTGITGRRDRFRWDSLADSRLRNYDMITNYESDDRLRIRGTRFSATLDTSEGRIRKLNRKQINNLFGGRDFEAGASAAIKVRGMDGTFIALNDNRPGFQAKRDGLIFLGGFNINQPENTVTII